MNLSHSLYPDCRLHVTQHQQRDIDEMIKWKTAIAFSLVMFGVAPASAGGGSSYQVDQNSGPFYVGAVVGYAWGRNTGGGDKFSTRGAMGGGLVGYRVSTGDTVLAIEADILGGQITAKESETYSNGDYSKDKADHPVLASLRMKGSWGKGDFRPYLTGGIAWQRLEVKNDERDTVNGEVQRESVTISDNQLGFTLGTGMDWQISDAFSGSFGYHYYRFTGDLTGDLKVDTTTHLHTIRLGGRYHF